MLSVCQESFLKKTEFYDPYAAGSVTKWWFSVKKVFFCLDNLYYPVILTVVVQFGSGEKRETRIE